MTCERHCWHLQGYSLTVDPPITPEICCYCGATRNVQADRPDPTRHGPFVPGGAFSVLSDGGENG